MTTPDDAAGTAPALYDLPEPMRTFLRRAGYEVRVVVGRADGRALRDADHRALPALIVAASKLPTPGEAPLAPAPPGPRPRADVAADGRARAVTRHYKTPKPRDP